MNIVSIEPTPSPNTMKLNLDETLPAGIKRTYSREDYNRAPDYIKKLLDIPGVKGVFHTADFIALDRTPKGDWQLILSEAREAFGQTPGAGTNPAAAADAAQPAWGEVKVLLQTFRGIPLQVRVQSGTEEARAAMPERFANAAVQAGKASPNLIKERKLEEIGIRYGELKDVLEEVVQEIDASYDDARLQELVNQAFSAGQAVPESAEAKKANTAQPAESAQPHQPAKSYQEIDALLSDADWKKRYAALQQIQPSPETLPLLAKALKDENTSVRRLATVYLGDIKEPEALPYLFQALKDPSPAVRRTAGDTLSDLGDPAAIGPMAEALRDPNKLVRWRAARFLYEAGDATALPALRAAENDPEFEVRMQVKMALERIEGGREAEGSVWQQMTRRNPTS